MPEEYTQSFYLRNFDKHESGADSEEVQQQRKRSACFLLAVRARVGHRNAIDADNQAGNRSNDKHHAGNDVGGVHISRHSSVIEKMLETQRLEEERFVVCGRIEIEWDGTGGDIWRFTVNQAC